DGSFASELCADYACRRIGTSLIPDNGKPTATWGRNAMGQQPRRSVPACQWLPGYRRNHGMFSQWMRRGHPRPGQPAPRVPASRSRTRPCLELLEDRLVPTALTYAEWQAERFQVDDVAVANVGLQSNNAPQPVNQSFG